MKAGIIGSGEVGQTLARAFKSEGYEVMLGTRNTSKENIVQFNNETKIDVCTFDETAKFGDIIVLAVKGAAAEEALQLAGIENLDSKIIIDATNPIADAPPTNGVLHLTTSSENSLMEQLQQLAPPARPGMRCRPEKSVMHDEQVRLCRHRQPRRLQASVHRRRDPADPATVFHLQPICRTIIIGNFIRAKLLVAILYNFRKRCR